MKIDISLSENFLDDSPTNSLYLHLAIICGALKYCKGSSKNMSFMKLAYIFDKTINLDDAAFSSKITLSPWLVAGDFKKSLVIAKQKKYVLFYIDSSDEMKIRNESDGDKYIQDLENIGAFENYINYIKEINFTEKRFNSPVFRCDTNEYK